MPSLPPPTSPPPSLPSRALARLLACTALSGFAAVLLGALGAHALKDALHDRAMTAAWSTAAHYQLTHTLAALAVLIWATREPTHAALLRRIAGWWLVGGVLFSGSLYTLALGGPRLFGPITPLGGLAFLMGWLSLLVLAFRLSKRSASID